MTLREAITTACTAWGTLNDDRTLCDLTNQEEGGPWTDAEVLAEGNQMVTEGLLKRGPNGQWSLA